MSRVVYRIDDRLIHGQVIEGWVHNLKFTRIVIASDRVKKDQNFKAILKFSVPSEISVDIFGIEELANKINKDYMDKEDTIVLFERPKDVLALLDYGVRIDSVNVGCIHCEGDKCKLKQNIVVKPSDITIFKDINAMGTVLEGRALPQDRKFDIMELIETI
ncbi:MAG: PTS system mannose/fructose/N-acetylgalactosamine-transporter subunit IIB [Elusimicrobiota bacterium]